MADVSATKINRTNEVKAHFGEFLKQAREKAGLSIEAVAQETKISKQFIIYLETGSVENLPGQVFGRGFIKNIARYLRSDTNEMLRLYDACWGLESTPTGKASEAADVVESTAKKVAVSENVTLPKVEAQISPAKSMKRAATSSPATSSIPDIPHLPSVDAGRKRYSMAVPAWLVRGIVSPHVRLTILGSVAAVMVVGVLGRWIGANMKRHAHESKTHPAEVAQTAADKAADNVTDAYVAPAAVVDAGDAIPGNVVEKSLAVPADANAKADVVQKAAAVTVPAAKDEESPLQVQQGSVVAFEQVLELNVSAPVEIKMTIDGKKQETTSFRSDTHRFTFHERAELMISDASAVDIIYNGKSLGVLGNKGRKRRIFLQAKPSESDFPH